MLREKNECYGKKMNVTGKKRQQEGKNVTQKERKLFISLVGVK